MKISILYILTFLIISAVSCSNRDPSGRLLGDREECGHARHARGFCIEDHPGYRKVSVFNPWQGAGNRVFRYYLVDRDDPVPPGIDKNRVIRTPVESIICLSTTHVALIDQLGKTGTITAVSNPQLINNPELKKRYESGYLTDIGYEHNLDYEKILSLHPDIVMVYGVGGEASGYVERLEELGISFVLNGEYLEPTPLAQAEWVKFVAAFFGLDELAEEKFIETEKNYHELALLASSVEEKPVVMAGLPWRNSWFVPGGRSFFATLVSDAGGDYIWKNNPSRENFPIDMEIMFEAGDRADIWLNTGSAVSTNEIINVDNRLSSMPPYLNGNIYNNIARVNRHGGNDYWEKGITEPHVILKDLVHILHPSLLPGHELVYYKKLDVR